MEHVQSRDGTRITFERTGRGPALVLVHGTMDDHRYWQPVLPELAARFTVLAVNRRGRGGSGPHGPGFTMQREFEDVAAVVEAAGEPVHLLGHSAGGRHALHAAPRIANLKSLLLYEPAPIDDPSIAQMPPDRLGRLERLTEAGDRDGIVETFWREVVGVPEEEIEAMRGSPSWYISCSNALTLVPELRSFAGYRYDPRPDASIKVPALMLKGSESPPFIQATAGQIAASLPNCRLVVLEGEGHEAVHTNPQLFLREVIGFLSEIEGGAQPERLPLPVTPAP